MGPDSPTPDDAQLADGHARAALGKVGDDTYVQEAVLNSNRAVWTPCTTDGCRRRGIPGCACEQCGATLPFPAADVPDATQPNTTDTPDWRTRPVNWPSLSIPSEDEAKDEGDDVRGYLPPTGRDGTIDRLEQAARRMVGTLRHGAGALEPPAPPAEWAVSPAELETTAVIVVYHPSPVETTVGGGQQADEPAAISLTPVEECPAFVLHPNNGEQSSAYDARAVAFATTEDDPELAVVDCSTGYLVDAPTRQLVGTVQAVTPCHE